MDFGVDPDGLCRVSGDFSQDATVLKYAVSDFESAGSAAAGAAAESVVTAAFERYAGRWAPVMSAVVGEADSMATSLAAAASAAVAADLQAAADLSVAVGSASATRGLLLKPINVE